MSVKKPRRQYALFKGNTGPVIPLRPKILGDQQNLDGNWSCNIALLDSAGATVVSSRAVTTKSEDNQKFLAFLTPTETDTVTLDATKNFTCFTQVMVVQNSTTTPPFKVEVRVTLQIKGAGI